MIKSGKNSIKIEVEELKKQGYNQIMTLNNKIKREMLCKEKVI